MVAVDPRVQAARMARVAHQDHRAQTAVPVLVGLLDPAARMEHLAPPVQTAQRGHLVRAVPTAQPGRADHQALTERPAPADQAAPVDPLAQPASPEARAHRGQAALAVQAGHRDRREPPALQDHQARRVSREAPGRADQAGLVGRAVPLAQRAPTVLAVPPGRVDLRVRVDRAAFLDRAAQRESPARQDRRASPAAPSPSATRSTAQRRIATLAAGNCA